jgi:hypothetical protein
LNEGAFPPPEVAVMVEDVEVRKEGARLESTEPRRESVGDEVSADGS